MRSIIDRSSGVGRRRRRRRRTRRRTRRCRRRRRRRRHRLIVKANCIRAMKIHGAR